MLFIFHVDQTVFILGFILKVINIILFKSFPAGEVGKTAEKGKSQCRCDKFRRRGDCSKLSYLLIT